MTILPKFSLALNFETDKNLLQEDKDLRKSLIVMLTPEH